MPSVHMLLSSVKHAALIGRNHVLDIDECIFSSVLLEYFKSGLDQITKVAALSLTVVNFVSQVVVLCLQ